MKSKPILFSLFFASIILMMASINIQNPTMPIKASFNSLTNESKKQVTCLAENVYFEAAHEPLEGRKAVVFVTFNRIQTGNYAGTVCDVVKQKFNGTCQFSWYCDSSFTSRLLTIKHTPLYNEILQMSTHMYLNFDRMKDVTNGATYYHADYVNPGWTKLQKEKQIGRHIFYKSKGDKIDRNKGIYYE
jgi:spore germination cell wall hydrolase CwlJ-like protein